MKLNNPLRTIWQRFIQMVDISHYIDVDAAAASIRDNVAFRGPNIIILFCAIVIASLGLNVNSIPVVIGAMLISPLMSPILGFGLALGTNDTDLLKDSLKNLAIMVGISLVASTLFFLISPLDMEHPTELLARTNPTIYDVLIALFGGLAGILEVSRKHQGTVMSGVAIATALMPPLCTVGYGIASWQWRFALGAFYLFFINCIFIALASYIGTKALGYKLVRESDPARQHHRKTIVTIVLIILLVPSCISGYHVILENRISRQINAFVGENKNIGRSYIYDYKLHLEDKPASLELFIAGEELTPEEYEQLYQSAETHSLTPGQLVFHQDAAHAAQLSDRDLMQEILRAHDEKLQAANHENEILRSQVDSLQQEFATLQLPVEQMTNELRTQYPSIRKIHLGRMTSGGVIMVVYTNSGHSLSRDQIKTLENWLKVRVGVSEVVVVQKNV